MPAKPIIATNPNTGEKLQLLNNAWVPMQDAASMVPKIDPTGFQDAQNSLEDIQGLEGRANPMNTGWMARVPLNQGAYDLAAAVKPIQSRGMIGRMMQMKAASATGATGFGALSEAEGDTIRSTMGNLDNKQSTGQFKGQIGRVKQLLERSYPGLTPDNPIDLSNGQSRTQVPKGSWYKDPYGNVRRNDNMDKGNPKRQDLEKSGQTTNSHAYLKSKYGLED